MTEVILNHILRISTKNNVVVVAGGFFFFFFLGGAKGTVRRTACMSEASLCCASRSQSRGGSKALPQKDRFSTDHSRNHPNFILSGKQEKEPQAGGREERQKGQQGPETSS